MRQQLHAGAQDGHITDAEALYWWRYGKGAALSADLSRIDFSGISAGDFPGGVGSSQYFNLLNPSYTGSRGDALVYGNIRLTLGPGATVTSTFDIYDFDIKTWSSGTAKRNMLTYGGRARVGKGTPFRINFTGTGTISP